MVQVTLPALYSNKLNGSEHNSFVADAIANCSAFVDDPTRRLVFFPEYTAHGIEHIQRVLNATSALIVGPAEGLLTAADVAVITAAVLLHDSAMHVTADSFLELVQSTEPPLCSSFDSTCWKAEWESYFSEATRWDDRQLRNILGDVTVEETPEDLAKNIRPLTDFKTPEDWSTRYHKFIGEFIRRQHARLAHEFAIVGIPGPASQLRVRLLQTGYTLADLAGLVARSHNMPIRETFKYLKDRYHGRVRCMGAHPVYLMALLRIADYLEFETSRAPTSSLCVRSLRNPISREHWAAHQSVREIRQDEDDREAIFIVAEPRDTRSFLSLRSLLDGLQSELDTSWSVIGEVFSRQDDLRVCLQIRLS